MRSPRGRVGADQNSLTMCSVLSLPFRLAGQPPLQGLKVMIFPLALFTVWSGVVKAVPLGPLASYAALGLAMGTLLTQAYAVAFPLAAGLLGLLTQVHAPLPIPCRFRVGRPPPCVARVLCLYEGGRGPVAGAAARIHALHLPLPPPPSPTCRNKLRRIP